jgi:hypothetical protein
MCNMKKLNESKMLDYNGGLDQCFWVGLVSLTNPAAGIMVAGGIREWWGCVIAI